MPDLDPTTEHIIRLAWCRTLGLADDALEHPDGRVERPDPAATQATFLHLFHTATLVGPPDLVSAARRLNDEVLALESGLLGLARGGRSRGQHELYFAEELPPVEPSDVVAVSHDPGHAATLLAACPADDVVGLADLDHTVTLVRDVGAVEPLAVAGYRVHAGILADMRVLVRPGVRRLGLGAYALGVAAEEAFTDGLVLQLRAPRGTGGMSEFCATIGLRPAGVAVQVDLPAGRPAG